MKYQLNKTVWRYTCNPSSSSYDKLMNYQLNKTVRRYTCNPADPGHRQLRWNPYVSALCWWHRKLILQSQTHFMKKANVLAFPHRGYGTPSTSCTVNFFLLARIEKYLNIAVSLKTVFFYIHGINTSALLLWLVKHKWERFRKCREMDGKKLLLTRNDSWHCL